MLRIKSRSLHGEVRLEDAVWDGEFRATVYRTLNTYINTELGSFLRGLDGAVPVYEVIQVQRSEDADRYPSDYAGPGTTKHVTLATGFSSPEEALEWMENNREAWETK